MWSGERPLAISPTTPWLVERWLVWDRTGCYPGGCLFVATASEFDDQPGSVRNHLVRLYQLWHHLLSGLVRATVANGTFRPGTDLDQFLQDLHGIMLAYHHHSRLLHDSDAGRRARLAFQWLVERARGGA